jgi:hypothetical protein
MFVVSKVLHRVYKILLSGPTRNRFNSLHITQHIYLTPILISGLHFSLLLGLPSDLFPRGFSTEISYTFLSSLIRDTRHAHTFLSH